MRDISLSEKLKVLVDVSSSSGICIATICLLLFLAFMFITTNKRNAKNSKRFYIIVYLLLISTLGIIYHDSLATMFDYMMNNFFILVYFPNLAIYLFAIVITNIILFLTIFNFKEDRLLKYINTTLYCMIHYLLILLLNVVTVNKLDVFDQVSIYKNQDASVLISLTSMLFMGWIIFQIIYKMIRKLQVKKVQVKVPVREIVTYKKRLPSNFSTVSIPSMVSRGIPNNHATFSNANDTAILLQEYDNKFTIDDYKKVLDVLQNSSNIDNRPVIPIEEVQESHPYIVSTRVIASDEDFKGAEVPKIEELLKLYNNV